jgi:hypothetical protein
MKPKVLEIWSHEDLDTIHFGKHIVLSHGHMNFGPK